MTENRNHVVVETPLLHPALRVNDTGANTFTAAPPERLTPRIVVVRSVCERVIVAWVAVYLTAQLFAARVLGTVDCIGLAGGVAGLTLALSAAAAAITRDSPILDPGLYVGGIDAGVPRGFRVLYGLLLLAVALVTAWRLM